MRVLLGLCLLTIGYFLYRIESIMRKVHENNIKWAIKSGLETEAEQEL